MHGKPHMGHVALSIRSGPDPSQRSRRWSSVASASADRRPPGSQLKSWGCDPLEAASGDHDFFLALAFWPDSWKKKSASTLERSRFSKQGSPSDGFSSLDVAICCLT